MAKRSSDKIRASLERQLKELLESSGCEVFTPASFTLRANETEIVAGLRALDIAGLMREFDVLVCPWRHVISEGLRGTVQQYVNARCPRPDCPSRTAEEEEYETWVFPRFQITEAGKQLLAIDQKKSPSLH